MAHWGWYWWVKKKHTPRRSCKNLDLCEIDSFNMYNDYQKVEGVRASSDRCALEIPRYELRAYLQDDNNLLVQYLNGSYLIKVETIPCNYGGYYYFFHCPKCDKRMRKLYCLNGQYQCRKCGNLAYFKQRLRPGWRLKAMKSDIEEYIRSQGGDLLIDRKPPRMHNKTYQKLKKQARNYGIDSEMAFITESCKWFAAEPWF